MKTSIFLLGILAMFTFTSCDKSTTDSLETNELIGTWILTKVSGGFGGKGYTAKFDKLQFTGTNMVMTLSKAIVDTRPYTLSDKKDELTFTPATEAGAEGFLYQGKKSIQIEQNKLVLSDPCCDLYTYEFNKSTN